VQPPPAESLGPVDPDERIEVSLTLAPRRPLNELEARLDRPMTREEFAASYGADPSAISTVESFARSHGLEVVESSAARRTVRIGGRAEDMEHVFGVRLTRQRLEDGTEFRAPDREAQIPAELQGIVEGVFGLDTRPIARRR
jgi:kumamolisin